MNVLLSEFPGKKLVNTYDFWEGKKKGELLTTVARRWGDGAMCLQRKNKYKFSKPLICVACVKLARHLARNCTASMLSYELWKYIKIWLQRG